MTCSQISAFLENMQNLSSMVGGTARTILRRKFAPGSSACVNCKTCDGAKMLLWTESLNLFRRLDPRPLPSLALALDQLGGQESDLERLLGVEARVAEGVVAVVEIGVAQGARAAGAFGDRLAGHLEMQAAGVRALRLVDGEEVADLLHDGLERPGLVAGAGLDGVAVHRVARPHDGAAFALHRAHERRQLVKHLVGAEAADQREASRLVLRVEDVDQPHELVGGERRAAL